MSIFDHYSDIYGNYQEEIRYMEISTHLVTIYNARHMEIFMSSFYAFRCPWRYLEVSMSLYALCSANYMEISMYFYALCLQRHMEISIRYSPEDT